MLRYDKVKPDKIALINQYDRMICEEFDRVFLELRGRYPVGGRLSGDSLISIVPPHELRRKRVITKKTARSRR